MSKSKFERLNQPNLYGYGAYREDGILVEVVQCDSCCGGWNLFLTRNGNVVANSIEYHQLHGFNDASKTECMRIARQEVRTYPRKL